MSNPYDIKKLDKQLSKVPSVSEASEPELKHRVSVTVSDPQHTMASKRGDKIEKRIRVLAKDESSAVELARHHYKKQGYKVHDANHIGIVEAVDLDESENRFSKYTIKPVKTEPKIVRKTNPSGRTTDHVEYEVHGKVSSQKRSFKSKKEAEDYLSTVKEDINQVDELKQMTLQRYASKAQKVGMTGGTKNAAKHLAGAQRAKEKLKYGQYSEETSYNSDDWYLFHKKTHKPAGSVGAKSIVGKNLGSQNKDKPDYDENHYAVRGMSVKSHLASLKKNEEDSSREKIFKNSKDKMKELFKNAHPQGNKRPDV